jgi:hypothetical protein
VDANDNHCQAKKQIGFLTDAAYEYTGAGLFVTFSHQEGIDNYKCAVDRFLFDGVDIKSAELSYGADAILFFKNGLIDYLEIWSYDGCYPRAELKEYTLIKR